MELVLIFLALSGIVCAVYFLHRKHTIRRYQFCPCCGNPTVVVHHADKQESHGKPLKTDSGWIVHGSVTEYHSAICCTRCDWEKQI